MQKHSALVAVGALILLAALGVVVPQMLAGDATPIVRWDAAAELDVPQEPADPQAAANGDGALLLERTEAPLPDAPARSDERVDLLLRGRVVDKFRGPVAQATVWLDFGRAGPRGGNNRQRRVPDPVTTDADGRFAFQGQTFRDLRVSLQVAHARYAPSVFDKDVGAVAAELDLGELTLLAGGQIRGRVTDLDGNGIGAAELRLQPENDNPMRWLRDREKLVAPFQTDAAGYYVREHVTAGSWALTAVAKAHTEGRSPTFVVEEEYQVDVDDIRLGPGYEVTGYVRNGKGEPIAKADVTMQSEARPRGGAAPGAPAASPRVTENAPWQRGNNGGGREHSTQTDAQGRFQLAHLPGVPMRLDVRAEGYLDLRLDGVDAKLGQPLQLVVQDGLRIDGRVVDGDGKAVTLYAVRAIRTRGLQPAGVAPGEAEALVAQLRSGSLDEATRQQVTARLEAIRSQGSTFGGRGGRGGPGGQNDNGGDGNNGRFGFASDLGKPEQHADGAFTVAGLQEGVYEVHVQSPEHTRQRSAEIELRLGAAAPKVDLSLDAGVFVAGVVRDTKGDPIAGARVELRTPSPFEGRGRGGRGGRGGDAQAAAATPQPGGRDAMRAAMAAQVSLETTTDKEGTFLLKHAPRGTFRLQAEAKGFANTQLDDVVVQGDRSGLELRMGALGVLAGKVRGLGRDDHGEARVYAFPAPQANSGSGGNGGFGGMMGRGRGGQGGGNSPFGNASVDADGNYELRDLVPGDYIVRCWVGSMQDMMRELAPQFFGAALPADTSVRGGETTKLDLTALRAQVGRVVGTVLHNGKPGAGFQVELAKLDETGAVDAGGNNQGGRGGRGGGAGGFGNFGRQFQATTAQSGKFTIQKVPAGSYRLRVSSARRGGTLHEEIVQVFVDVATEPLIQLNTCQLAGALTRDDGGKPEELSGRATLLAGALEAPADFNAYVRENGSIETRVQAGAFRFDAIKSGNYLLVVTLRGRERTTTPIVVAADATIQVPAGQPTAAPDPNAAPGGRQGGGGGGNAGGGRQGGGGQAGGR